MGEWLPTAACSGRIVGDVVIDFVAAGKRLRPEFPAPPIHRTLALADEMTRRLDARDVNQAGLAHLYGLIRARVTQILNLLRLHPAILAFIRGLKPRPSARLFRERRVRPLLAQDQDDQLRAASALLYVSPLENRCARSPMILSGTHRYRTRQWR